MDKAGRRKVGGAGKMVKRGRGRDHHPGLPEAGGVQFQGHTDHLKEASEGIAPACGVPIHEDSSDLRERAVEQFSLKQRLAMELDGQCVADAACRRAKSEPGDRGDERLLLRLRQGEARKGQRDERVRL